MKKVRTFLDAGVLITAMAAQHRDSLKALNLFNDPHRVFASSIYVQLEVLPKTIYFNHRQQLITYRKYFERVKYWPRSPERILSAGFRYAQQFGLNGMDALHVAAAVMTKCDELITTEAPSSSIHRANKLIQIITL